MPTRQTETAHDLRKRAVEKLRSNEGSTPKILSPEDKELLFHELQVHQIELEMQNEELRRNREELEVSRSKYFDLYDLAPVGYLTIGENGLIKEANLTAATMFGVARNYLLGKSLSRFIFSEDHYNYYLTRKKVVETGEMQNLEMRLIRADGVLFWSNLQTGLVLDGEYGITITDTTKIKQAEQELRAVSLLRESEERFRNMANAAPVLIWISGSDKLCHWFNQVWLDFTGRTMEQEVGNGWAGGVHPDDLDRCLETYVTAFDNRQPFSMEYRLRAANGQYRWLIDNGAPTFIEKTFTGYIGSCIDITDQKIVEKEQFETAALLANITNSNPDAIFYKDLDGRYKLFNTAAARFIGKSAEEVLGKNDYELFPPDVAEKLMEKDRKTINGGTVIAFEETITNSSGLQATFLVTKGPLTNAEGEVYGVFGVSRNITERKQLEEELREAKLAAEAANRAKSEFLANMSHEIRSPMNGLLGMAQLMEYTKLTKQQKEYLEVLKGAGKNLLSLINDILDLSKIEAGKVILEPGNFSLSRCINDVILMQKPDALEKHLEMNVAIAGNIPNVLMGDQLRIKQILLNLIGNAIKFTKQGAISISAQLREQYDSSVLVQIAVRDTGIGILPDALEHIFKPFVQADSSMTRKFGGSGLGLSISLHLAELMGGSISVESRPEIGSCFTITLPLACSLEIKPEVETLPITPRDGESLSLRILLVEDNELNIMFGAALLKKIGHNITVAENGRECLDKLEHSTFDLVLMDIQMPIINGEEALHEIRLKEQETGKHLPVIAVTAFSMRGDEERFLEEGFDGYVSKPFAINDLLIEMRRVMGKFPAESVV